MALIYSNIIMVGLLGDALLNVKNKASSHSIMIMHVEIISAQTKILQSSYTADFIGQLYLIILITAVQLVIDVKDWEV